ncbi:MAG: hypothetical protein M1820_004423 [Bogoriella megaspora]|nr:MAG: hypothetical protein M1820_004423 [Bogoriella megaspora]
MSRPSSQHRMSVGAHSSSHPRTHSHSLSLGSVNSSRVSRRKSTSSTAASHVAALAHGAVRGSGSPPFEPSSVSGRRSTISKTSSSKPDNSSSFQSPPASLPNTSVPFTGTGLSGKNLKEETSAAESLLLSAMADGSKNNTKTQRRRASEGARLVKGESKRMASGELKCETCGKAYKHSSCLTKHLWEHTPEWSITSKLLISKHQQVQLLEAASVLVQMNQDGTIMNEPVINDNSSASPAASGSSDPNEDDDYSSIATSPPAQAEEYAPRGGRQGLSKRDSSNSSVYSRSYQSVFSSGSVPTSGFSHFRQWSHDDRPVTAATSVGSYRDDEESADLAAAVGLLSCSQASNKPASAMLPPGAPPVPPVPAKFVNQMAGFTSPGSSSATPPARQPQSTMRDFRFPSYHKEVREIDMEDDRDSFVDEEIDGRRLERGRSDEHEEGIFGAMEE